MIAAYANLIKDACLTFMSDETQAADWFEDYANTADDLQVDEYDISASPNDFNVLTINSFLESGAVRIPGFQRNYVWDLGRASKLIESLILGLPVPQVFLYETERNRFLVIDGQQRLMSIYYFVKQRFPRKDRRTELRQIFDEQGKIPAEYIHDDNYFENFRLRLPERAPGHPSKFKNLAYETLGEYKTQFELRTIRNVIIKQNSPLGDDSSMFEVFNRLNTGGVNLSPQEIRMSMYHSDFYTMLYHLNSQASWRRLLSTGEPDLHLKDLELLLRGIALLVNRADYAPSMVRFLNQFSIKAKKHTSEQNKYLSELSCSFFDQCNALPPDAFVNKKNRRFNTAVFEAVFVAACTQPFLSRRLLNRPIDLEPLQNLENDSAFLDAMKEGTTQTKNVNDRIRRAEEILGSF